MCELHQSGVLLYYLPEKELPAEVALLDDVHVGDDDLAAVATDTHHGEILQDLAANGTGADHEPTLALKLGLELAPKHRDLTVVPEKGQE